MCSSVRRLQAAPRCHARSKRTQLPCRAPAVRGYRVCRFHGARGGARGGNRNAWKHGTRGSAWLREADALRGLVREARRLVSALDARVHGVVRPNHAGVSPTLHAQGRVGDVFPPISASAAVPRGNSLTAANACTTRGSATINA